MTITDLIKQINEFLDGSNLEPYGFTHMKEKLLDHFGDKIVVTEINGTQNVVTLRHTASAILRYFYQQPKDIDPETEKLRLIKAAANLVKSDIKSVIQPKDVYPTSLAMSAIPEATNFLPQSLRLLLNCLLVGKDKDLKLCALGQAIMPTRPRIRTAPLQLGLGVQMHSHFASRFLIDTLNTHGFCSSYSEVQKYERCAAVNQGLDISVFFPGQFVQYVADNVDHDIRTLDGCGTFHGMGIIAVVTPNSDVTSVIQRVSVSAEEIAAVGRINIKQFTSDCGGLGSLVYESQPEVPKDKQNSMVDLLWKTSLSLRSPRPGWAGFMQMIHKGNHPGQASVMFLPMIDMKPTDMTCVNSTLHFVSEHARHYGVTQVLTIDQPLWWLEGNDNCRRCSRGQPSTFSHSKTRGIPHSDELGSIGHLMAGTGLQELLEVKFAGNTVAHILSGKAVTRAIRGHLLLDSVLHTLLLCNVFDTKLSVSSDNVPVELEAIADLCDDLVSSKTTNTARYAAIPGSIWSQPIHQVPVRVPEADDQVRKHASRCSQAVHSRNACHQEERSLLGRVVSRPGDRTGAYEEPEDNWWSHEREEHDRNTATCLVSIKTCKMFHFESRSSKTQATTFVHSSQSTFI